MQKGSASLHSTQQCAQMEACAPSRGRVKQRYGHCCSGDSTTVVGQQALRGSRYAGVVKPMHGVSLHSARREIEAAPRALHHRR
ncbi:hypothetical protein MTO96_001245 [Rhipicephalus appendiculatus]